VILPGGLGVEQRRLREMLKGKTVGRVFRRRKKELGIEFVDGTHLFIDWKADHLEMSVTGGSEDQSS